MSRIDVYFFIFLRANKKYFLNLSKHVGEEGVVRLYISIVLYTIKKFITRV